MPRPYTFIFSTASVDGLIAGPEGGTVLSCEEDFILQHKYRDMSDAVMVGSSTALIDNPRLTVRRIPGRSPARVLVDSRLRVPPSARIFSAPGKSFLLTSEDHDQASLEPYLRRGVIIVRAGTGRVDLASALEKLYTEYGIKRLMVEGGGRLNCALLRGRLVDEVRVTLSPVALGLGTRLFHGEREACPARLALLDSRVMCGGWVHLVYKVIYI